MNTVTHRRVLCARRPRHRRKPGRASVAVGLLLGLAFGCREADGPLTPSGGARAFVVSDPSGATIYVDNESTGRVTPDTISGLGGRHDISVRLDTVNATYGFTARVFLSEADSLVRIEGPLVNRCAEIVCFNAQFQYYAANQVRFANNPVGTMFLSTGSGDGLIWPSLTNNSYASTSMVGFAGVLGTDTVALGIYDNGYLAGRPAPAIDQQADFLELRQTTWIVPPSSAQPRVTVRGIEVAEQLIARSDPDDVLLIRLTFRNITHEPLYAALDPTVPAGGATYDAVYLGFLLDPDIGDSGDDMLTYEPSLDLVYAYDAHFGENTFGSGFNTAPGLIGVRLLERPPGSNVILNGWTSQGQGSQDWRSGQANERNGWNMLSGLRSFAPDHPDRKIGHLPVAPGDVRISVSAGPTRLAPGDTASITVAVVLAPPVTDTFTSGVLVEPGDPADGTRAIRAIATDLFAKAGLTNPTSPQGVGRD